MRRSGGKMAMTTVKIPRRGVQASVQPRIRLTRSFDQLNHTYQGYVLGMRGVHGENQREFSVAVGEGAHAKHQLQVGDSVSGLGVALEEPRLETAELYKESKLRVIQRVSDSVRSMAPWHGIPPDLPTYRERGHRRLATRTYGGACIGAVSGAVAWR